jgi:Ca2+-transporting ATPase
LRHFVVSEEKGLTAGEAQVRLAAVGLNELSPPKQTSLLELVVEQFEDRLVQILVMVAVVSSVLSLFEDDPTAFVEPLVIVMILVINAFVGIWQGRSAEGALDALKKLQPENACVLREGRWLNDLPARELVPGDIIFVRVGDKVPADARILALKTTTFSCDEGSLTGESASVSKFLDPVSEEARIQSKTNMIFSGTMISNGAAYALVVDTGARTEIGKINQGVEQAKQEQIKTPLAQKLDEFGNQLTYIIGGICLAVWCFSYPEFSNPVHGTTLKGALYYAKVAVALGVAAIPEGLPAVITLCLSLGTRRMAKRNVIVRKLPSVETLGCTTVICSDKTGTLTTNQMTCVSLVTLAEGGKAEGGAVMSEFAVEGVSYNPSGAVEGLMPSGPGAGNALPKGIEDIATIAALCNEAKIVFQDGKFERIGEPTEAALKVLVEKLHIPGEPRNEDPFVACSQYSKYWEGKYAKLATLEFSRDRKSMSVLCRPWNGGGNKLFVKGAPDLLVARCTRLRLASGKTVPLTNEMRHRIMAKVESMAVRPLRCLGLAMKEGGELGALNKVSTEEEAASSPLLRNPAQFGQIESGLTLVGICGIKDPARPEAARAILQCREAGVRVIMITGDSRETAVAIARDVHIFGREEDVSRKAFRGADFFGLSEQEQRSILRSGNLIFCRTEPQDKQQLVKMLQQEGEVPAMTGDGVNDAPALQQAAIGVAMGITGTEVCKQAADMVLADDNFATIVSAVEEGRCIYANMQAFICFLISCNIGEILTIFGATVLGLPEPLTPLHLLWVNLVTDGPPATALGFNPPDPDAMLKPPRSSTEPILSRWLLIRYLITGAYVGFATVGIFVQWFLRRGVTWKELTHWGHCVNWEDSFAPDLGGLTSLLGEHPDRCDVFGPALASPQTLALSVLVTMEMFKALSAVSLDNSILRVPPWKNPWLLGGVALPFSIHLAVVYFPFLNQVFGVSSMADSDWLNVLQWAAPILLLDEVLKAVGRYLKGKESDARMQERRQRLLQVSAAAMEAAGHIKENREGTPDEFTQEGR